MLSLRSNLLKKSSLIYRFSMRFNDNSEVGTFCTTLYVNGAAQAHSSDNRLDMRFAQKWGIVGHCG